MILLESSWDKYLENGRLGYLVRKSGELLDQMGCNIMHQARSEGGKYVDI